MLITVQANTPKAWLSIRLSPVVVISKGGWNVIVHLSKDFMNQELLNIRSSMLCSAFSSHTLGPMQLTSAYLSGPSSRVLPPQPQ